MLNEDDKKYLKGNIEKKIDDLDKKMSKKSSSAKSVNNHTTEIGKKLQELYKKDEEREDTKKYLEELKNKNDNGEATIAQKIEMLSLNLKTAIPDDFKVAMKETSASMKKGANQAISGASHLVGRAMMTNPLTALLWQNRDIAKAMWDMGMGGAKILGSAIGGIGRGAAGLVNASINMFKKKDKPKTEEEVPEQEETPRSVIDSDNDLEDLSEEEKSTAQKINELHDLFFKGKFFQKQEKEEKQRQNILSKGLSGLGKSMQAVNKVIEVIAAKQKLILGGLMLGAVGILALVGWLKDGGMNDLINKVKEGFATEGGKKARKKADNYVENQFAQIKTDTQEYNKFLKDSDFQKGIDVSKQSYFVPSGDSRTPEFLRADDMYNRLQKENKTTEQSNKNVFNILKLGTVSAKERRSNIKGTIDLKFPFEVGIWHIYEEDEEHCGILIGRTFKRSDVRYLYFTRALKASVNSTKTFKKNERVAILDAEYRVYGDWDSFYDIKEGESFEDAEFRNRAEGIAKDANKIMDSAYHTEGFDDAVHREQDKVAGVFKKYDVNNLKEIPKSKKPQTKTAIKSTITETPSNTMQQDDIIGNPEITKTQLPPDNTNAGNKTDTDIENKKQELKDVEKRIEDNQKAIVTPQQKSKEPVRVSLNPQNNRSLYQPSEMASIDQFNRMTC